MPQADHIFEKIKHISENGDPQKEVIALGQTYFAVKTRQQELAENFEELTENQKSG